MANWREGLNNFTLVVYKYIYIYIFFKQTAKIQEMLLRIGHRG